MKKFIFAPWWLNREINRCDLSDLIILPDIVDMSFVKRTEKAVMVNVVLKQCGDDTPYDGGSVWYPLSAFSYLDIPGIKYVNEKNIQATIKSWKSLSYYENDREYRECIDKNCEELLSKIN